jgi:hypothetical protein
MPASPNPVVGLRSVSYLCGGLAPRFLFSSSVFLLAGNMEKPTTTHQPTTGQSLTAKHYEGIVLHDPLQTGARPKESRAIKIGRTRGRPACASPD